MKNLTVIEDTYPDDCYVLIDKAELAINDLGHCIDTVLDTKKTKLNVVGSIFRFTSSLTKLTFSATSCAIKNIPKVVVAVAAAKRELVNVIEEEVRETQKQYKEDALDEKIKQLRLKD